MEIQDIEHVTEENVEVKTHFDKDTSIKMGCHYTAEQLLGNSLQIHAWFNFAVLYIIPISVSTV